MPESTSNRTDRFAGRHPAFSPARARVFVLLSLGILTMGAWALTLRHAWVMSEPMGITAHDDPSMDGMSMSSMSDMTMAGMPAAGWSPPEAIGFVAMWTVMMAAMMLPAMVPMVLTFAAAQARRTRTMAIPTWIFIAGYLLVWLAAGILVYIVVQTGGTVASALSGWALATVFIVLAVVGPCLAFWWQRA